jgi:hypothetical protein
MKNAPWFVDFFAPAIEDSHHEKNGDKNSDRPQPPAGQAGSDQNLAAALRPGPEVRGESWQEIQKEQEATENPLETAYNPLEAAYNPPEAADNSLEAADNHLEAALAEAASHLDKELAIKKEQKIDNEEGTVI